MSFLSDIETEVLSKLEATKADLVKSTAQNSLDTLNAEVESDQQALSDKRAALSTAEAEFSTQYPAPTPESPTESESTEPAGAESESPAEG